MEEALYYSEDKNRLYIRAEGHITANLCFELKNIVFQRFEGANKPDDVIVDLSDCDYMDSTFMGLLIGFNKKLTRSKGKHIKITNPSEQCTKLLNSLGIMKIIDIVKNNSQFRLDYHKISDSPSATAEILLSAHENLMSLNEENKKKFENVRKILRQHVEQKHKKNP